MNITNKSLDSSINSGADTRLDTRRWLRGVLMVLLGLYLLDTAIAGRLAYYINDRNFTWLAWFGGFTLLALGIVNIIEIIRENRAAQTDTLSEDLKEPTDTERSYSPRFELVERMAARNADRRRAPSWAVLGLVAIPAVIGIVIPARPLSANAITTSGISTSAKPNANAPLTEMTIAPEKRNVLDWVRTFSTGSLEEFVGQPADVIGFVYRSPEYNQDTQFMAARFALMCCVADASALGVVVQTPDAMLFAQDSWVHVKGNINISTRLSDGQKIAVIVADSVTAIDQPTHPYLYP